MKEIKWQFIGNLLTRSQKSSLTGLFYDLILIFNLCFSIKYTPFLNNRQLLEMTCKVANVLKEYSIKRGDRVIIFMPAMPLTVACMLACARMGAVHWYE